MLPTPRLGKVPRRGSERSGPFPFGVTPTVPLKSAAETRASIPPPPPASEDALERVTEDIERAATRERRLWLEVRYVLPPEVVDQLREAGYPVRVQSRGRYQIFWNDVRDEDWDLERALNYIRGLRDTNSACLMLTPAAANQLDELGFAVQMLHERCYDIHWPTIETLTPVVVDEPAQELDKEPPEPVEVATVWDLLD